MLKEDILNIRNEFITVRTKAKNKCKWVTKRVTKSRRAKKEAWNKYVRSGRDMKLYKAYTTKLNKAIAENRKAKLYFEDKTCR